MEVSGTPVELYKSRSPATDYVDPMAKAQALIQAHHAKGLTEKEFKACIVTPSDHLLYLIIHGRMSDHQRATNLQKLAKLIFDEQKRQQDALHREREIELKRQNNVMRGIKLQEELAKRAAKEKGD